MPGSRHEVPELQTCDQHPNKAAVIRVQGETDSFGCEMIDMCQECFEAYREWTKSPEAHVGRCDWCKNEATDLQTTRDYEEGMTGRVYEVCGSCRKRRDEEDRAELDWWGDDD